MSSANKSIDKPKEFTEQNEKELTREKAAQMLTWVENRKLDVLSEASNPFKKREKFEMVIELQTAKQKMGDDLHAKFGVEMDLFSAACKYYDLLKPEEEIELTRDALVIQNNFQ